jgi:type VI secretion system protein ImpA
VSNDETELALVSEWLEPMHDEAGPCGKDLEYDNENGELQKAAQGKPENQFGPGEPPNWREVSEKAASLMGRTRDLRVALLWVRAQVNLNGFSSFPIGLKLIEGLLVNFWDHLHPMPDPDDQDPYARANALAILPQIDGLLGDLRQCAFFELRSVGDLRLRSIEVGLGQMSARSDETAMSRDQLTQMIALAVKQQPSLGELPKAALAGVSSLAKLLNERFAVEAAPDLRPLVNIIKNVQSLLPVAENADESSDEAGGDTSGAGGGAAPRLTGNVKSRDDALRAIDMICEYLDRTEPTNPAQLLLRRARKLINHNFLQLMKELAPDALNEVARVMGVDPETVTFDD